ncbi:Putative Voltage-gated shaker-like K channel [Aspergillus calidoustus]|uniref:Putative Voltage-gated shaker-like K channel n=1 Tax=Aspergillus calidoustus TaxID=454130 RepID=A0A0U5GQY9_ASPCI|nr:Putative Voltage-gated shaker-like K channel [Aspergillus calidoustus]
MAEAFVNFEEVKQKLPPAVSSTDLESEIAGRSDLPVLVVLDDDPTGTQTCHGINVLTVWDEDILAQEFLQCNGGFFILTNSRALPTPEARQLIHTICTAVKNAAIKTSKRFEIVLRGDSTLRGHFPDEPEVAEEVIEAVDGWVLAPFFRQGGRYTIDDIHYVADAKGNLVPAAQTPFAKDATFGYRNSNLRKYVVEKSGGSIAEDRVQSISLEDIRNGGQQGVTERLLTFGKGSVIIVNAVVDTDMEIFTAAQAKGRRYLYRTGAAFVSTRLGIPQIPPVTPKALGMSLQPSQPGGLILAGSYVPKTTEQLQSLIDGSKSLQTIVLKVEDLLKSTDAAEQAALDAADKAGQLILKGQDVLVMTSRALITGNDGVSSLKIGSTVAAVLVLFLRLLVPRPRYIIAKGGITSSDAACKGLRMRRAQILGQVASGVPLWQCNEPTSKFSGIPYVVFPGNVGEVDTLRDLVASWAKEKTGMQYQRLGKSSLKISKVILGCMTFGNPSWEGSPWVLSEEEALPLLKKAYDCGINTWDTANTYSNGLSEVIVGRALREYSIPREKVVILSKLYYPVMDIKSNSRPNPAVNDRSLINQMGLSRKHIFEAVEASLRRLGTSYIDVLQLHRVDETVKNNPEEVMRALHDLVQMGKVHYLGASSMYCWQLARLHYTAKFNGWTGFTSMQNLYNLLYREEERDTNPFCDVEGIGLIPWSPLARGLLARPSSVQTERSKRDAKTAKWFAGDQNVKIIDRVQQLAQSKGCSMSALSMAWLLSKGACPVVGLNSAERIEAATEAFSITLSDDEARWLEEPYRPLEIQAM